MEQKITVTDESKNITAHGQETHPCVSIDMRGDNKTIKKIISAIESLELTID